LKFKLMKSKLNKNKFSADPKLSKNRLSTEPLQRRQCA
jgi:hypothetical protein